MEPNTKVLVGFSGGVDSTASVIMLKQAGYTVTGFCFNVLGNTFPDKIQKAADSLGIKLITKDVSALFREKVIMPFKEEYEAGRTPNPCILCNPEVKFRTLIETADEEGCYYIATGHYAGIEKVQDNYYVKKAANLAKDQSYMLYRLPQSVLKRIIFPLDLIEDKAQTRALAADNNASNANEKDSQDICFIPDGDYKAYLAGMGAENKKGNFLDLEGNVLGRHQGILNYTIGQRKGLGVTFGKPKYVVKIGPEDIILGDNEDLLQYKVTVNQLFWAAEAPAEGECLNVKLRYSAKEAAAELHFNDSGSIELTFKDPQRAPTPGQSAVIYRGNIVLGGGIIC